MTPPKILVVDDDRDLVDLLAFALRRAGMVPIAAYDAPSALERFESEQPDLAVLDVNLGAWSGLDLLRDFKRRRSRLPVLLLTGRDTEDDKVRGLDLGADDYLTKPFSHRELFARIRVQLRRLGDTWAPPAPEQAEVAVGPLTLDLREHTARKDGQILNLTVTEFRLLHYLMLNAGAVVPVRTVLRQVWGYEDAGGSDVLRVTVHRLRRKLEDDPSNPRLLHTAPGVGFMLKPTGLADDGDSGNDGLLDTPAEADNGSI